MPKDKPPPHHPDASKDTTAELSASEALAIPAMPAHAPPPATPPTRLGASTSFLDGGPASGAPEVDHLLIVQATDAARMGTRVLLDGDEVRVGRKPSSHVVLAFDDHVSGTHARFVREGAGNDAGWAVADAGSRNGTFLNGKRVTASARLANGDVVRIGTTSFAFVSRAKPEKAGGDDALPFPIAISARIVAHQAAPFARVKALLDGIETTLRMILAAELSVLRASPDEALRAALADELSRVTNVVKGTPLSMGDWAALALRLAKHAERAGDGPIAEASRAVAAPAVASAVQKAVTFRNKQVAHGKLLNELAFRADEEPLGETFRALVLAARPLCAHTLASVAEMEFKKAKASYTLYALVGPTELFPTFRLESAAMLEKRWGYLLRGEEPPLSLAPLLFCDVAGSARKLEVFLAEGLVLGPEGAAVRGRGVASNDPHAIELQWSDEAAELSARVAEASAKRRKH